MHVNEAIQVRRTIRKFQQRPLLPEQLKRYVEAARLAPSGANLQPLKYYLVSSSSMAEKVFPLLAWAGYLNHGYDPREGERPVGYIVVCADTAIRKNGYEMDVGAAVENMILSALEDGVGACWLGSVKREQLRELLNIPEELAICCVVALGYPAEAPEKVEAEEGDIKYYLENGTLKVPKRPAEDVIVECV